MPELQPLVLVGGMKMAILTALIVVIVLLSTILSMLFQPGAHSRASQPTPRARQAAVGQAVLQAAQGDPTTATMVRAAVQAASDEDRALASELIAALSRR